MASLKLLALVLAAQTSVSTSVSATKSFAALTAHEQESYSFDDYTAEFNLEYAAGEEGAELQRKFERNKAMILAHNNEQRSWKMAVNKFAHMDAKEFKECVACIQPLAPRAERSPPHASLVSPRVGAHSTIPIPPPPAPPPSPSIT